VVVARGVGASARIQVQKAVHTSLIMALIFGVFGGGLGFVVSDAVLTAMGNTGNLLELAVTYCHIYFCGVPFLALTNYLSAIFRAKGDAKTPLVALSISGVINVLLNVFFVLVLGLSVEGVALATAAANVLSFVILLWRLAKDKDFTAFSFKELCVDKPSFFEIVRIGLPAGVQGALFSISNMLIQSSIVSVNNAVVPVGTKYQPIVNGNAASANLEGFVYTAMNAVQQGAVTFTGQNMGAEKPERVKPILYNCFLLSLIIGISMSAIVLLFKTPLLGLYGVKAGGQGSLEQLAFEAANLRLWMICAPYFLCGLMDDCTGVLRGLGKSLLSTVIALVGSCLLRVVWIWTVFPLAPTLETIFLCYPITWMLTMAVSFLVILVLLGKLLKNKKAATEVEA
jgi:putative MATE family efflux protein